MNSQNNNALQDNNHAEITGVVTSDFTYSHTVYGEDFYLTDVSVKRLSGTEDTIPVMVSDRLIDISENQNDKIIHVAGQFQSFNQIKDERRHLKLFLFAKEIDFVDIEGEDSREANHIFLDGYICKDPNYRITPYGREVTDVLLAVNRSYKKSDYIPCICWGRNAKYADSLDVSTHIKVYGRIQSRVYKKTLDDGREEYRTAIEVSVSRIEKIKEVKKEV